MRLRGVVKVVIAIAKWVVFVHRAVGEKYPAQAVSLQPVAVEENETLPGLQLSFSR